MSDDESEVSHFTNFSEDTRTLPINFADDVLELEMKIDSEAITPKDINQLLGLYAQAIDYYVSIQSERYHHFKMKTMYLLMKPHVMETLEDASSQNGKSSEGSGQGQNQDGAEKLKKIDRGSDNNVDKKPSNIQRSESPNFAQKKMPTHIHSLKSSLKRQQFQSSIILTNAYGSVGFDNFISTHLRLSEEKDNLILDNLIDQEAVLKKRLETRLRSKNNTFSTSDPSEISHNFGRSGVNKSVKSVMFDMENEHHQKEQNKPRSETKSTHPSKRKIPKFAVFEEFD